MDFTAGKGTGARLRQVLGLLCLCYGLACWAGAFSGGGNPLQPLEHEPPAALAGSAQVAAWETVTEVPALERALAEAAAAGTPVVLDWYADWCISCKVIEKEVLDQPATLARLAGYRKLRFDITASTTAQRELLDHYGLFGPPIIQFFAANGNEVLSSRVVGEIDLAGFLAKAPE